MPRKIISLKNIFRFTVFSQFMDEYSKILTFQSHHLHFLNLFLYVYTYKPDSIKSIDLQSIQKFREIRPLEKNISFKAETGFREIESQFQSTQQDNLARSKIPL